MLQSSYARFHPFRLQAPLNVWHRSHYPVLQCTLYRCEPTDRYRPTRCTEMVKQIIHGLSKVLHDYTVY